MFVLGNMVIGVAEVLDLILGIYLLILALRAILSWVGGGDPRNPIVAFLFMTTEPVIRTVRRYLPMRLRYFPLDIAFLGVLAILVFLKYGIVPSIAEIGRRLR